ncbi:MULTISPECIES: thioesterase II family protein [unclassified Streptomyces]|uniref:thioesterase II family protein n=1 Tax=unclassified Streptomyces TaxID=2593676 RepID=UPI001BEAD9A4|nr:MULTISPECIES: thioesterase domain-containing protein [unclassified Streptomyces]MBT2408756.1 hypothetical protein [Streptomyces sp. ISL-21]MBT2613832.1 hypothetical protein [Streptomyces sp. ISL-87]
MTAWLRCFDRRPTAAVRVVCFPHAGGPAYFRDWHTDLSPEVEVHAVQYPGRGGPAARPLVDDARRMADMAMEELTRGASDAVVFPGGHFYLADEQAAVVAEVARRLAPTASPAPRA